MTTGALQCRCGWTDAAVIAAGIETIDGTERHPVRSAELWRSGPAIENLHAAPDARYNYAADDTADDDDFPDTSFRQAGVTIRYPF